MGIYINFPDELNIGKAARLINEYGGEEFKGNSFADVPEGKVLVSVAENREGEPWGVVTTLSGKPIESLMQESSFDAAAVCYSQAEYDRLRDPLDTRTIHQVLIDKATALELVPELASEL